MKFERYGNGIVKGMALTLKTFFRPPITLQYPEDKLVISRRLRGNEFVWYPDKCTGCATCAKCCPQGNIEIVTHIGADNDYIVDKFEIDTGRCIFCGLCIEACPYEALALGLSYECSQYRRKDLIFSKEDLFISETRQPSGYARPEIEASLPKQSLLVYWDKKKEEGGQKLDLLPRRKRRKRNGL